MRREIISSELTSLFVMQGNDPPGKVEHFSLSFTARLSGAYSPSNPSFTAQAPTLASRALQRVQGPALSGLF